MDQDSFDTLCSAIDNDIRIKMSSRHDAYYDNPCFVALIDAGPEVMPFIFARYARAYDWLCPMVLGHLYEKEKLEARVIKEKNRGRCDGIRLDWLKWGEENGFKDVIKANRTYFIKFRK